MRCDESIRRKPQKEDKFSETFDHDANFLDINIDSNVSFNHINIFKYYIFF